MNTLQKERQSKQHTYLMGYTRKYKLILLKPQIFLQCSATSLGAFWSIGQSFTYEQPNNKLCIDQTEFIAMAFYAQLECV